MSSSLQKYEFSDKDKRIKDKFSQQCIRGIFVGLRDDSAGWVFYVIRGIKYQPIEKNPSNNISAFLTSMSRPSDDSLYFPDFLNVAHELSQIKNDEDTEMDRQVN